jgi:hypothetical protein
MSACTALILRSSPRAAESRNQQLKTCDVDMDSVYGAGESFSLFPPSLGQHTGPCAHTLPIAYMR